MLLYLITNSYHTTQSTRFELMGIIYPILSYFPFPQDRDDRASARLKSPWNHILLRLEAFEVITG